jgi:hypothetical protein
VGSEESLYDGRNKRANWKVKASEMVGERRRESLGSCWDGREGEKARELRKLVSL